MSKVGKTNKSFSKRLKITRNGKVLARKPGQNHFNAKESRSKQLEKKGVVSFQISKQQMCNFLPNK